MEFGDNRKQVSRQNPYKKVTALKVLVSSDREARSALNELEDDMEVLRPRVRADCSPGGINEHRPCPWYGCKYHLGLDINDDTGSLMVRDLDEMSHTCVLDVAEAGGITLEEIGEITNLTRERIRQLEVRGLLALKPKAYRRGLGPTTLEDERRPKLK